MWQTCACVFCKVPKNVGKHTLFGCYSVDISKRFYSLRRNFGPEFVVLFFSHSWILALKSSSKSHQMTTCFIQNDEVFTERNSLFSQYSFLIRKLVIWWLFNDDLRVRGQELEKKGTTNSAPLSLVPLVFRLCYTIYIQILWEHWHFCT